MAYGFTINADGDSIEVMKKIQTQLTAMGISASVETKKVESAFLGMGEKVKGMMGELKGLLGGALFAGGAFAGFEFLKSSVETYDKLEQSVSRVNTVLRSTKNAAGLSANAIEEQAKELSRSIVNGRAEIMDAQGMLLSFTGIKGPIFGETTKAVADFAQFYKEDMTSAALAIGKALNDPAKGMGRLQKQGVTFTEEQKKQIVNFEKQGKLAKAQQVILKELNTEFGGQAAAFALTDEGKLAMASKQWGSMKLQIGEVISKIRVSLVPLFTQLVDYVKMAFNSTPVQFFLAHLRDLITVVLRAIPMWVIYKGLMTSIALAKSVLNGNIRTVISSLFAETAATEGATIAAGGLKIALLETGVGAFAIALGYVIEKCISWNNELDKTVDKLTNFKELTEKFNKGQDNYKKIQLAYSNLANESPAQKSGLLSDITSGLKETSDDNALRLIPQIADLKQKISTMPRVIQITAGWRKGLLGVDPIRQGMEEQLKEFQKEARFNNIQISQYTRGVQNLTKMGVKPLDAGTGSTPPKGVKDSAINTSNLSGASGGLGQAKTINIKIDTMQKITTSDNHNLKQHGQDAVEVMLRTVNNLAYSEGGTQ